MFNPEKAKVKFFVGRALAVVVLSIIGTVITLYFLSATPTGEALRVKLGLDNLKTFNINTSKTDKIVIEESSAIIDASKKISQSVVSITGKGAPVSSFFGTQTPEFSGTGFIITSDGLIATNKHVIKELVTFTVTTPDGKAYKGKVVAKDPVTDLALVKIEARGLPVADIGDSEKIQVGQWVIAVGNALGEFQNTVTVGVVSALERSVAPQDSSGIATQLDGLIQTDAAINPGNSGGPLVNLSGQVVGINSATTSGAQNIGFAIQANDLSKALDSYRLNGKIIRPYIGVRYQSLTKAIASSLDLSVEQGALLVDGAGVPAVATGSPAAKAGLKKDDIITKIDDKEVTETRPLARIIRDYAPGDKITLIVLRGSKIITVSLTLGKLEGATN
ncbi:MAG: trypsin-like peptidase domain-containing protein [Patescibacteria group bacterium]